MGADWMQQQSKRERVQSWRRCIAMRNIQLKSRHVSRGNLITPRNPKARKECHRTFNSLRSNSLIKKSKHSHCIDTGGSSWLRIALHSSEAA